MYFVQFTILLILLNETFSSLINDKLNQGLKKIKDKPRVKIPKDVPRDRSKFSSNMRQTSDQAKLINDMSTFALETLISSAKTTNGRLLVSASVSTDVCPFTNLTCDFTAKYRTNTGMCNNKIKPFYGSSNTPFKRILPPAYDDAINSPRTKSIISGNTLPHPRLVSLSISQVRAIPRQELNISQIYAIFGQFLIHDLSGTSATSDANGIQLDCPCGSTDTSCMSLIWPSNDPWLPQQTCMKFTRSSSSFSDLSCSINYREQLNLLSSYIDGSAVYGMNDDRAIQLRTFSGGLLGTSQPLNNLNQQVTNGTYLPLSQDTCSSSTVNNFKCFLAGEFRTSENLALVSMHTLFNREHNRIASELFRLNPTWSDEKLYQETRRIVIALIQHITFNEWLPMVIGDSSLSPLKTNDYYTGYNENVNPALFNEFSTAAFRFGHSLIKDKFGRYSFNESIFPPLNFTDMVFKSDFAYELREKGIESIIRGTTIDNCWKFGSFGNELQNKLFGTTVNNVFTATDLLATNIYRGRDHGLQPYVKYVKYCHNIDILSFNDLKVFMSQANRDILQSLYSDVNDIDLYVGALLEIKTSSLISSSKTFGCIVMKQFADLKNGDRFYYENGPGVNPYPFALNQLETIKNVSLAGLICNNYEMASLPKNVFLNPSDTNQKTNCDLLKNQIDLSRWKVK